MTSVVTAPPVPPTDGMPEYQAYPIRYGVGSRAHPQVHAADLPALLKKMAAYPSEGVFAEHVAPDGRAVVTAPWAGGTWGGLCGSTRWVQDHDGLYRQMAQTMGALETGARSLWTWQPVTANNWVDMSQAWWVRGDTRAAARDGFRVECHQSMRHDGACGAFDWSWDGRAGRPLP